MDGDGIHHFHKLHQHSISKSLISIGFKQENFVKKMASCFSVPPSVNHSHSRLLHSPPLIHHTSVFNPLPQFPPQSGTVRKRFAPPPLRASDSTTTFVETEEDELDAAMEAKIGARVRVSVPLKVYHVPKVSEIDLCGREGIFKQYAAVWKGKRISANLPFKIQFVVDVEGKGPVKFLTHLKEDEFEFLE